MILVLNISRSSFYYRLNRCDNKNNKVKGSFHGHNGNILCDAAANGLDIIYQPIFLTHELIRSGRFVSLFEEWETDTFWAYAVYSDRKFLLPKVRSFIDFMVEHVGPHPYWYEDTSGS